MDQVYLHDIPLGDAIARLEQALEEQGLAGILGVEDLPLDDSCVGRVLAGPVWAKISSPHYHASAMDGFAVRSAATVNAMLNAPISLTYGEANVHPQASYVDTGDPLPEWADAVIPIENVEALDPDGHPAKDPRHPDAIRIRAAVTPWSHVRPLGEDIVATQLVLPEHHRLRPVDLGAIAACGHDRVQTTRRPRVAILPTGTELTPIGQTVKVGDIIEYNSVVLAAQVREWGGLPTRFSITPDNFEAIRSRVAEAAVEHDLVLLNAGSSAGSEDFSARVVASSGDLLVHGVAVRPGHPVILGMIRVDANPSGRKIPIIGIPGYPVSAALTGEIFVEPLLRRWQGLKPNQPEHVRAILTRKVTSPAGDDDYMRVVVGRVGERLLAAPISRGAGVITSLVRADGIVVLGRGVQGAPAGTELDVRLYRPARELDQTIFAIGSHDLTLDLMAQYLAVRGRRLASANVGSLGGLTALRRGEAHLAGSHLLDPQTGEYNLRYIREYMPGIAVKVVRLVGRDQGLITARGNPKAIHSLDDLRRSDVQFVNRQRGAGTRVLLDYHLKEFNIDSARVNGYNQEEYTHLAVAAAIASGRADCGLGIAAAAQALELEFTPLYQEPYELVIPAQHFKDPLLEPFWDVIHDPRFRAAIAALPGYDVERMGEITAEIE
jgi:putative molybdopterin biosynthesis protein